MRHFLCDLFHAHTSTDTHYYSSSIHSVYTHTHTHTIRTPPEKNYKTTNCILIVLIVSRGKCQPKPNLQPQIRARWQPKKSQRHTHTNRHDKTIHRPHSCVNAIWYICTQNTHIHQHQTPQTPHSPPTNTQMQMRGKFKMESGADIELFSFCGGKLHTFNHSINYIYTKIIKYVIIKPMKPTLYARISYCITNLHVH